MRVPAIIVAASICAGSAHASGTVSCLSPDEDGVSVELTIGSLPVLAVVGARIVTPGSTFVLQGEDGQTVRVGQAFSDDDGLSVDFTDPDVERVMIRLRLVSAEEQGEAATAGTLAVAGEGAWPLACAGP